MTGKTTYQKLVRQHSKLVDKKFLRGIDSAEQHELDTVNAMLDDMDAPYYESISEQIEAMAATTAAGSVSAA